ncbi:GMC family oxidoreductase [Georgenia daeguensis]|uniref:GMC family oxidoreductase N-terminal domain-containing protein n=1 Tax=Georgenia daeguensis TaxID=908355 RepID=A0ABP8EWH8_9MICO
MSDFDYIIIGAGAAGSVLANRLSEDPGNKVLLLEHGGPDTNPMHHIPKGFFFTLRGDRYTYHYPTQPIGPSGQVESWTRGKVLGGSTAVNGMMWSRGAKADFDQLAALGIPGWDWERVLAVYRTVEDHNLGPSPMRGAGGPLGVSVTKNDDEVVAAILASAQQQGWDYVDDVNAHDTERVGFTPSTIRDGIRSSSYRAFVHPVRRRPNLTIKTHTRAGYLLFDGKRAIGVRTRSGSKRADYTARKEIIVATGTVETPLLLERSGIGRPEVLAGAGVRVRVESPHVGERVIEQRGVSMQVRLRHKIGPTQDLNTVPKQGWEGLKYLATRRGPISTGGYDLMAHFKSSPELDRPDIQGIFVPMALDTSSATMKLAEHSGIMFMGYQVRPTTTGSVHLSGKLPENLPIIDARFLEDEADRAATAPILEVGRTLLSNGPVADYILDEEFPGPAVSTPEEVLRYSLDAGGGIFHAVGSAAMGPNDDDVVDPQLRVRGVDGLRVADASVLPVQVSGNTAAPTTVVGWIAADHILADN